MSRTLAARQHRRSCISGCAAFGLAVIVAFGLWTGYQNLFVLETTEYEVTAHPDAPSVPDAFDGFRIVQVADLHAHQHGARGDRLIQAVAAARPDIIVLTGDQISMDSGQADIDFAMETIRRLSEIAPVYLITGNHEAGHRDIDQILVEFEAAGAHLLRNETTMIERGGQRIELAGVDDPNMRWSDTARMGDAAAAEQNLAEVGFTPGEYTVLLAHRPDEFTVYAQSPAELVLAGHNHGGQVRIPGVGGLINPKRELFPAYTEGSFTKGGTEMIVSRGLGDSLLPVRINNPYEVVVVTLHAR